MQKADGALKSLSVQRCGGERESEDGEGSKASFKYSCLANSPIVAQPNLCNLLALARRAVRREKEEVKDARYRLGQTACVPVEQMIP